MDRHELIERVGLYSLLRSLYTYPLTTDLLAALAGLEVPADSPLAAPLEAMRQRILPALAANGDREKALERLAEDLNVEMTRLLEGPGRPVAPPYASYYLHGGQLMGPEAVAVRRFYVQWEAIPASGLAIPPDHVALEFGFLAYLAQAAVEGTGGERARALRASLDFLRRHMVPWLPRFLGLLRDGARDPFFTALADFTAAAVRDDLQRLEATVKLVDGSQPRSQKEDSNEMG